MFLPTLVSHLSHLYLITVLLIPVVGIIASVFQTQDDDDDDTTDDGVDDYTDGGDDDYTAGDFFSKTESTMRLLMINQTISFVIGGFANLITLLAIPYVRLYYGSQFSVLQLNSVVLILHLSMADLLCSVLGAPNIILVFLRKKSLITENFCYYVGLLRYLGANLDFNTIAMISCCVARHNLCRVCSGVSLAHDDHDKIFGGWRVYLVCGYIWLVTILTILSDIIKAPGAYTVATTTHICDFNCPKGGCLKIFQVVSIINNIVFMFIFYIIILFNLYNKRKEVYGSEIADYMAKVRSISRTVAVLIFVYVIGLIPVVAFNLGSWPPKSQLSWYIFYIFNPVYYWVFGVNVLIYLATNYRIREAYRTFVKDMWKKICWKTENEQGDDETLTSTSAFWIQLRQIDRM